MDFIITFFRDILDGPLYIIVAIISGILICSCIGYLAEQSINKKRDKAKYEAEHFSVEREKSTTAKENIKNQTIKNSPGMISNRVSQEELMQTNTASVPVQDNSSEVPTTVSSDTGIAQNQVQKPIPEMSSNLPSMVSKVSPSVNTNVNSMQNMDK